MRPKEWLQPPRHLLAIFLAITLFLAAALAWLSWRLLQQERALAGQQAQEHRELAADAAVNALEKRLSALEEQLARAASGGPQPVLTLTRDSVLLLFDRNEVLVQPAGALLYRPFIPAITGKPGVFAAADRDEFLNHDFSRALAGLGDLSRSANPGIRAEALARMGRIYRKSGHSREALDTYGQLRRLGSAPVSGLPAELLARDAVCLLLEERQDGATLKTEAAALYHELQSGRWPLTRGAFEFYSGEARRRAGISEIPSQDSFAMAEAAGALWREWVRAGHGEGDPAGRRCILVENQPVLMVWRSSGERLAGFLLGMTHLKAQWMPALESTLAGHRARIMLVDANGRVVLGGPAKGRLAVRLAAATGLPWTLQSYTSEEQAAGPGFALRRRLLISGAGVLFLIVLGGSYFTARAVTRELQVSRLQSDFVSAVSHEFRTPLTSLRQFTELLANGRVEDDERRRQFYDVLARETQRLHRLVEGLLRFSGMEAGAVRYELKPLDVPDLLHRLIADFRSEAGSRPIQLAVEDGIPSVRADREALSCAVWNLLDNALKYSADGSPIEVHLERMSTRLAIGVRDQGVGIPRSEQRRIFGKFVRGEAARSLQVRGTGIGLALTERIVRAHGGEITVQSEPGRGSIFTILLPAAEDA